MNGIINIYKEQGYTSHDVVAKLRRILKMKRIGHTGTLDPNAEGVLPVCVGQATKVSELLMDKTKTYVAGFRLGSTTDTQDMWGKVISMREVAVTAAEVEKVVLSFVGDILQIPPMYSAIKQDGKKLYELAREGKEVERKPRKVSIHSIRDFRSTGEKEYQITVECSKGTYIRTLCHDIGEALGCGAHMTALTRIQSGKFGLDTALRLAEVESLQERGELESRLIPVIAAFDFPKLRIEESFQKWLYAGNAIPFDQIWEEDRHRLSLTDNQRLSENPATDNYYVCDHRGELIGIYRRSENGLKVLKFLYQASEE